MSQVSGRGGGVFSGWTYYERLSEAVLAEPHREAVGSPWNSDIWAPTASRHWMDSDGREWMLTLIQRTGEPLLFNPRENADGPAVIGPSGYDVDGLEALLGGWMQSDGSTAWLKERFDRAFTDRLAAERASSTGHNPL